MWTVQICCLLSFVTRNGSFVHAGSSRHQWAVSPAIDLTTGRQCSKRVKFVQESKGKRIVAKSVESRKKSKEADVAPLRQLKFWENMICGAISRSIAQTFMHPANTMKTVLQSRSGGDTTKLVQFGLKPGDELTIRALARPKNFKLLTRGAGAQFIMSVPHGAVNFAILELVRSNMGKIFEKSRVVTGFGLDFLSSCVATFCCSVVSTPQMMITDNIMAGTYPNFVAAIDGLAKEKGILGFYTGWFPGLAGKIPSYALTWMFFQELKRSHKRFFKREPLDVENSIMGCAASAATVCIMIPMDTIKTRLVTQMNYPDLIPYKGIADAAVRITREEGIGTFYRGLAPRLVSVVPMIGIQFGVYEYMKKVMLARNGGSVLGKSAVSETRKIEEISMEVAADDDQPFPAPISCKKDPSQPICKKKKFSKITS